MQNRNEVNKVVQRFNNSAEQNVAVAFSGDLDYAERRKISDHFSANEIKILVTNDLCMRCAFNSNNVVMVVNFCSPIAEDRTVIVKHHSLRAGRAGQFGKYSTNKITLHSFSYIKLFMNSFVKNHVNLYREISDNCGFY